LRQNVTKYVVCAATFAVLCVAMLQGARSLSVPDEVGTVAAVGSPALVDYLIFIFRGMDIYVPAIGNSFRIPILWAVPQLLVALLVVSYPTEDLTGYATQVLPRVGGRNLWWAAKCLWVVACVVVFYLICLVVAVVFTWVFGGAWSEPNEAVELSMNEIATPAAGWGSVYWALVLCPLVSIAMSCVQMVLSFVLKPVVAFLAIVVYMVASVYFASPFVIADYSMILRNEAVYPSGLNTGLMAIVCVGVSLVAVVAGGVFFRSLDLLGRD
jgi:hypothetical protein